MVFGEASLPPFWQSRGRLAGAKTRFLLRFSAPRPCQALAADKTSTTALFMDTGVAAARPTALSPFFFPPSCLGSFS